jgi:hypothetical protein
MLLKLPPTPPISGVWYGEIMKVLKPGGIVRIPCLLLLYPHYNQRTIFNSAGSTRRSRPYDGTLRNPPTHTRGDRNLLWNPRNAPSGSLPSCIRQRWVRSRPRRSSALTPFHVTTHWMLISGRRRPCMILPYTGESSGVDALSVSVSFGLWRRLG